MGGGDSTPTPQAAGGMGCTMDQSSLPHLPSPWGPPRAHQKMRGRDGEEEGKGRRGRSRGGGRGRGRGGGGGRGSRQAKWTCEREETESSDLNGEQLVVAPRPHSGHVGRGHTFAGFMVPGTVINPRVHKLHSISLAGRFCFTGLGHAVLCGEQWRCHCGPKTPTV